MENKNKVDNLVSDIIDSNAFGFLASIWASQAVLILCGVIIICFLSFKFFPSDVKRYIENSSVLQMDKRLYKIDYAVDDRYSEYKENFECIIIYDSDENKLVNFGVYKYDQYVMIKDRIPQDEKMRLLSNLRSCDIPEVASNLSKKFKFDNMTYYTHKFKIDINKISYTVVASLFIAIAIVAGCLAVFPVFPSKIAYSLLLLYLALMYTTKWAEHDSKVLVDINGNVINESTLEITDDYKQDNIENRIYNVTNLIPSKDGRYAIVLPTDIIGRYNELSSHKDLSEIFSNEDKLSEHKYTIFKL